MSSKNNKTKVCPECGGRMESMEIGENKDGVTYHRMTMECIECGYVNIRKNKRNKVSVRDWNMTD